MYAAIVGVDLLEVSERTISIPLYFTVAKTVLYDPESIPIASIIKICLEIVKLVKVILLGNFRCFVILI